ncbi:ubiquinone anaerobic biosynthesis protein UbiV [Paraburkholderia dinghuensis]|uniref:Ubiquinone biosynthesis protein UbiV n=1 Tax=Paraburkholderia dinghuensis TaxID=2305225 RepID=A0A3N6NH01_9BURK|nr:U32 family peptidase [Paraburkholderia dinghuensis]RQH08312.1 U32 family peptidase [Paraburkholderia dinghuensis]
MKIALGPLQYYWSRVATMQFYEAMTDAPVDIVYLGETVCSRRHELRLPDWLEIADMLAQAGKEVVLSTQVLLESGKDITTLRQVTGNGRYMVEANDMGAVHCVENTPFVAGPWLNVYNAPTLGMLAGLGAQRWVMPLELGRDALAQMQADRPPQLQTEVFAYGRMPLAFSARCFTARNRNLPRDNCQYVCIDHPDGLMLNTRDGEPFLVLNGISTQSARVYNLIGEIDALKALKVDVLRLSPQSQHMTEIVKLFDDVIDGRQDGAQALSQMHSLMPEAHCDGFWHGMAGLSRRAG